MSDPFDSISIPNFDAPPAPVSSRKPKTPKKPKQEIVEDADPLPLLKDAKPVLAPNPHQARDLIDDAGRVYALPKVDLSEIEMMASVGMSTKQIADAMRIPPSTMGKLIKNDPTVQEAIDRGTSRGVKMVTDSLFNLALKGNVAAAIFWLKNKGGWQDKTDIDQRLQVETKMNFEDAVEALKAAGIDPSKI